MIIANKKKNNILWRFIIVGVLSFFVFLMPARQAHAVPCDACVVAAMTGFSADMTIALTATAATITAAITAETATLIAFMNATFNIPSPVGIDPLVPTGSFDYDLIAGFASVTNAISMMTTQGLPTASQPIMDAHKYTTATQGVGEEGGKAVVPDNSVHCATAYGFQARTGMTGPTRAIMQQVMAMVGRDRMGGQGSVSGSSGAAQAVCESAAFRVKGPDAVNPQPRNGTLAAQFQKCVMTPFGGGAAVPIQPAPASFADADLTAGSVFDPMQYRLPPCRNSDPGCAGAYGLFHSKDGRIEFDIPTGNSSGAAGDAGDHDPEWAFVAAWRFCEHLLPESPPPPNSAIAGVQVTLSDLQRAVSDMNGSAVKTAAIQACMHAVAYRTACPATTQADSAVTKGQPANCFQIQAAACHRFTDPSDPQDPATPGKSSGMGITNVGNEEANAALKNCDTDGISQMMIDYIWAHRCGDETFMSRVVPQKTGGETAHSEDEVAHCRGDLNAFEAARRDEQRNFLVALDLLLEANSKGGKTQDVNPVAKPFF